MIITGSSQRNLLTGTLDDDILYGLGKGDTLTGLEGADTMYGGSGFDRVTYRQSPDGVSMHLANGFMATGGNAEGDVFDSIENAIGSPFADYMVGDDRNNIIEGRSGDDELRGNYGHDTLRGESGNDTLHGGGLLDYIYGGSGDDHILGGGGIGLYNLFALAVILTALSQVSSAIFFPMMGCTVVIMDNLFAHFVWKESLSRTAVCGVALGLVSILLVAQRI